MDDDIRVFGEQLGRLVLAKDWAGVHAQLAPWLQRASTSDRRCSLPVSAISEKRFADCGAVSATDSTSVFQPWQCGHWPCHFTDWPPHSVQE